MTSLINSWAQKILVVIIVSTIIEIIVPNGKNKKYIKMVIGIYIVFVMLLPIINLVKNKEVKLNTIIENTDKNNYLSNENITTIDTNSYIEEEYKAKIKEDIKQRLASKEYIASNIELEIKTEDNEGYGAIAKLKVSISKNKSEELNKKIEEINIVIGEKTNKKTEELPEEEIKVLKEYLSSIYYIKEEDISIQGG